MINLLYNKTLETAVHTDYPDELYYMMSYMKFTISPELETNTVTKFGLPFLRNIEPNTTPNNRITQITENYIKQLIVGTQIKKT